MKEDAFVQLGELSALIVERLVAELARERDRLIAENADLKLRLRIWSEALDNVLASRSSDLPKGKGYNGEPGGGEDAPFQS